MKNKDPHLFFLCMAYGEVYNAPHHRMPPCNIIPPYCQQIPTTLSLIVGWQTVQGIGIDILAPATLLMWQTPFLHLDEALWLGFGNLHMSSAI